MKFFVFVVIFLLGKEITAQDEENESDFKIMPRILMNPLSPSESNNVDDYHNDASSGEVLRAWNSLFNETDDIPLVNALKSKINYCYQFFRYNKLQCSVQ